MALPAAPAIQLASLSDFSGGLNYRADALQLGNTESPNMLNVDLGRSGGISRRDAVADWNWTTAGSVPKTIWNNSFENGNHNVIIQGDGPYSNRFAYCSVVYGGFDVAFQWQYVDAGAALAGKMRSATWKNDMFVCRNAEQHGFRWSSGAVVTVLDVLFNENFAIPLGANIPQAKCITAWGGYMWVANTVETGTAYKSRIRWSHPNGPADWRSLDYIDIDIGHDGDEITALVPFNDRLLIFKNRSVHVLYGYDPSTFGVQLVSGEVGTVSQEAVAVSEDKVYFFSNPDGVYEYSNRTGVQWSFNRLASQITDGHISLSQAAEVALGWINRRLWVSVPIGRGGFTLPVTGGSANNAVFVLDPDLGHTRKGTSAERAAAEGAWTRYDLAIGPMVQIAVANNDPLFLACSASEQHVVQLHYDADLAADITRTTGVTTPWSTPDSAALSITGDITLQVQATLDWTSGSTQTLMAKWETAGNQRSYSLSINATGFPVFEWSNNGTTVLSATSLVAVPVADNTPCWIRVSLDVVNGANKTVLFEFGGPESGVFTHYSTSTITTAGNTSIFDSTASATVGARLNAMTDQPLISGGAIHYAWFSSGLPGVRVTQGVFDATRMLTGTVSSGTTQVWSSKGGVPAPGRDPSIDSYYHTKWIDIGEPARKKRWRRPEIAVAGDAAAGFGVDVYRDYNAGSVYRHLSTTVAATDVDSETIKKLSSLGSGRSVSLALRNNSVVVSDSMNRTNSATTMGSSDSYAGGVDTAWTPLIGTWGIFLGSAYEATSVANAFTVIESGYSDAIIEATFSIVNDGGLVWRASDFSNLFTMTPTQAYKQVAGVFTAVGSAFTAITAAQRVRVVVAGDTHTIYVNGTQVSTFTSSTNSGETKHGLRSNASVNGFQNFLVRAGTPAASWAVDAITFKYIPRRIVS